MSSGRISTGVWQLFTKSRVTVNTKSGLVRYILVRNFSACSIVRSGRRLTSSGAQPFMLAVVEIVAQFRPRAARHGQHGGGDAIAGALQQIPDQGTADAEAEHHEFLAAEMIHQRELIVGVGIPGAIDLERA